MRSARAQSAALAYLRRGGVIATFNYGYRVWVSVLVVIDSVKRVNGRNFPVEIAGRHLRDPVALVADVARIPSILDWHPQFENLDTIVGHTLAWEQLLDSRKSGAP